MHEAADRGRDHDRLAGQRRDHGAAPALPTERRTCDAEERLQQREQQGEDQREMTELRQHVRTPRTPALPAVVLVRQRHRPRWRAIPRAGV